jgi:phosphoribosylanthranilate isomerase
MRVKICGITRAKDAKAALDWGADALGFVVASPSSPRNLPLTRAQALMRTVPVFSTKVAVTATHDPKTVLKVCSKLKPDALQLHTHTRELIRAFRRKHEEIQLILTTPIRDVASVEAAKMVSRYSDAVLADTPSPNAMGGTGRIHDWHLTARIRKALYPHPLILAGGLTPDNVKAAIDEVKPFAVDVSTGVEKRIGVKDDEKIREFILNAKEAFL